MPEDTMLTMADEFIRVMGKLHGKRKRKKGVNDRNRSMTQRILNDDRTNLSQEESFVNDDEDYLIPVQHVARM